MNSLFSLIILPTLVLSVGCNGQIKNAKTVSLKINGNCEMCEKNVENVGNKKKVSKVAWDKNTKIASVSFDVTKTSEDEILKRIALAGYDNEKFLAPDNAYEKLPKCCKYERKTKATSAVITKSETEIRNTIKKASTEPLIDVYTAYFGLKDALIMNDGITASNKAKDLFKALNNVKMEKLAADQHATWIEYVTKLLSDAERISGVSETKNQREHFGSLSKNMFEVMKVIKPSYPVYYDHCPMYNNGKGGDWISKESPIKNPFYGSQMLTCGKTVESLK